MTEYPEGQTPRPDPSPEDGRPGAASPVTAPYPGFPPPARYFQPGVYPPPPEFYEQGASHPAAPSAPAQPPYPGYAPGYAPYPPTYQQYPPQRPPQYPQPYTPYPQYPPQYPPYPGYAPQPASVAQPREPNALLGLLWTLLSAVVSYFVYAALLGWQFGLGMIGLLLVHEMGHFVVIRGKGLPAGLPIFIPLVGAFVTMRRAPLNVRDEAEIALAGPLAGTIGGVACLIAYWRMGIPVLLPLAYFSFYLNLLNLIPVGPLDGARVTAAISKWIWPLGLLGVALGAWYTHDVLLIILGVVGAFQLIGRFSEASKAGYYTISMGARIYITLLYFGLAAVLAYATFTLQPLMQAAGRFF